MPKGTYDITTVQASESRYKGKPFEQDYTNARHLLNDFGVKASIPEFKRYADLETWTSEQIRRCLA